MGSSILSHMTASSEEGIKIFDMYKGKRFAYSLTDSNPILDINITSSHVGKVALLVICSTVGVNGLLAEPINEYFDPQNAVDLSGWSRVFNSTLDKLGGPGLPVGSNPNPQATKSHIAAYAKVVSLSDVGALIPTSFIEGTTSTGSSAFARIIFDEKASPNNPSNQKLSVIAGGSVYYNSSNTASSPWETSSTGSVKNYRLRPLAITRSSEQATFEFFAGISGMSLSQGSAAYTGTDVPGNLSDDHRQNTECSFNLYYRFVHGVSTVSPSVSYSASTSGLCGGMGAISIGR